VGVWTADGDSLTSFGEIGTEYVQPIWSHDETRIAVSRRTDDGWPLYRISSAGDDLVRLTEDDYNRAIPVAWSHDDTKILAEGRLPGTIETRILIVDADGGGVTDITPFPGEISLPTSWLSK
jgi:Tol biopolymer transport system component